MKNCLCFIASGILAALLGISQPLAAQTKIADYTFGGNAGETCAGGLVTTDGGYLSGGSTQSDVGGDVTMPSPAPPSGLNVDFWIVKADAQGNRLWDKRFGGADDDRLVRILPASNGGFLLCGWSRSGQGFDKSEPSRGGEDYWVMKVDEQGNKQWDKRFGTSGGEILSCAIVTPDGGYLLVGTSGPLSQAATTPAEGDRTEAVLGYNDIWMVKIDANGAKQWDKRLGGPGGDLVYDVANASGGGFVLGGLPLVDSGWSGQTPAGDISGTSFGQNDWWIIKTDARGVKIWDHFYGGTAPDYINALLATPDGGILAAGSSQSPVSGNKGVFVAGKLGWVLKLDAQGNKQWEQVYNSFPITGGGLQMNPAGGYFLGGGLRYNPASNDIDFWLANIDANGLLRWEQLYGGTSVETLNTIVPTTTGNVVLFGTSGSDISRDKTANSRGGSDIWIVRAGSGVLGVKNQSEKLNNKVSIFPNPSSYDNITLEVHGITEQKSVKTEVLNNLGQQVRLFELPVYQNAIRQRLDVTSMPVGIYILRLHTIEGIITKQLVVE